MPNNTPPTFQPDAPGRGKALLFLALFLTAQASAAWAGTALTSPAAGAQGQTVSGAAYPASDSTSTPQQMSLSKVSGKVSVKREGALLFEDARDRQTVKVGDTIKVDEGACDLILENNTTLTLAPGTTLGITQATYDQLSKNRTTLLKLDVGRLKAVVGKLHGGSRFEVTTPTALAAVRGTTLYLGAGTTLGKLFTELYVDESSGGVLFRNPKTGVEFLVPAFGGSNSFGDGSLLAPRIMNELERKQFVDHWENQVNEVLAQLQIEEQANASEGEEDGEGSTDDAKKSEQNTSGNAALEKLLKLLQRYNDNLAVIGPLFLNAVQDLKDLNDIEVPDVEILSAIRADLLENVTDLEAGSEDLLDLLSSGEDLHETLLDDKEELKDLRNEFGLTYIEAAGIILNDSYVGLAQALGLEFEDLLEAAYDVLLEYGFTIVEAQELLLDLLERQHDLNIEKIEGKADQAETRINAYKSEIPETGTSREQVLLQSEGLSEILAQGEAAGTPVNEWAYETVKYGPTQHFVSQASGNGDLGVVAGTDAESEFLNEGDGPDAEISRSESTNRTRALEKKFSSETIQHHVDELEGIQGDIEDLAEDADDILRNKAFVAEADGLLNELNAAFYDEADPDLAKYKTLVSDAQKIEFLRAVEREAIRREIRNELDRIKGDLTFEQQLAQAEQTLDAQTGKVFKDIHGNRVRVDQYIFMPNGQSVEVLSLTLRTAEGPQRGISAFSFGVGFNRPLTESDGLLRDLPWGDYVNVVEDYQVSERLDYDAYDPHYEQYIVHEHNPDLALGENALYPRSFYAEFRNPQGDREGSDVIRFSETYSDPLTLEFESEEEGEEGYYPPVEVLVQGRETDAMLVTPFEGDSLEHVVSFDVCKQSYSETLYVNGEETDYYRDENEDGGDGVQTGNFDDQVNDSGLQSLDYYRNLPENRDGDTSEHLHPAYFHDKFIVGEDEEERTLIGLLIPIDNQGKVIDAPGFTIRGIRDLVAPNPLVNDGNYNLEVMFFYGHDEEVYNETTGEYDRHFASDFEIDTIITPEIFKPYGTSNNSTLFPAAFYEDGDGYQEE